MVKKILLVLGCILGALILLAGCGLAYLYLRKPAMAPPSAVKVAMTPENIARGKYLFESVADCGGCHSQRDFTRVGGPEVLSGRGRGVVMSDMMKSLPGVVVSANITPDTETGLGSWTDGEKIRAIREGISRDGHALFPMMPYANFSRFSDEDVQAIVAYTNSMPAVRNPLPKTKLAFPVNLMITGVPHPVGSVAPTDKSDPKKYGEFLAAVGGCSECHTPGDEHGTPVPGKLFAGGQKFETTTGTVLSANISPDIDTGIGKWSEEFFLKKFYDYKEYATNGPPPAGPGAFTLMPWLAFSQRAPEELTAIYAYLKSVPAVRNPVETHPGFPKPAAVQ